MKKRNSKRLSSNAIVAILILAILIVVYFFGNQALIFGIPQTRIQGVTTQNNNSDISDVMELSVEEIEVNDPSSNRAFEVKIKNSSSERIWLPSKMGLIAITADMGSSLTFTEDNDGNWSVVGDLLRNSPEIILEPNGEDGSIVSFQIEPLIDRIDLPIDLAIMGNGNYLLDDGSLGNRVISKIKYTIKP